MAGPLYRLGKLCARHRWVVLVVWLIVVAGITIGGRASGLNTSDNLDLPGTDSQKASDELNHYFPKQANGTNPIVLKAKKGKLTEGDQRTAVDDGADALRDDKGVISVTSPLSSDGSDQITKDETVAYYSVTLKDSSGDLTEDEATEIINKATDKVEKHDIEVSTGGYLGQKVSRPPTENSEAVGLAMAVIVLLFTFGTAVAMSMPILTAILGLATSLGIVSIISSFAEVPTTAPTLAIMIGLGVGIDYALFLVTRHKEQLDAGMDMRESVARATATSGGAVLFAAGTVIIALVSLAVARIPLVTQLGYISAIAVLVAATAAVTLLPALLAIAGRHIDSLKLPTRKKPKDSQPHGWRRWALFVGRHPIPATVFALIVLGVLAYPVTNLHLGQTDTGALSKDETARVAYDEMSDNFGPGTNGPFLVSVKLDPKAEPNQQKIDDFDKQQDEQKQQQQEQQQQEAAAGEQPTPQQQQQQEEQQQQADEQKKQLENPATDTRLQDLRTDISKTSDVDSVSQPLVNDAGTAAILTVTPKSAPSDTSTEDLVTNLRDNVIPKDEKDGLTAHVGGRTAGFVDLASNISDRLPLVILTVVALSFLLLMLAFRSILVPLKAGLMNVISVAAAFGVVTWVFQEGHGVSLLGLDGPVPIVSFVPLMMFAILFGLSMDYEVFLMTHIKEHWKESDDAKESVVVGLQTTGRVITSAALIMVSVFCAFILNGDPTIKQFGVGMAVAVALDATIVRCLLVPAIMELMGRAAWWFPRWMERLMPKISIEGDEYFEKHDAAAKPAGGDA